MAEEPAQKTDTPMTPPRISFEFFPPQSLEASFRLWETVQALAPLNPAFVSVTYGAGGTTRKLTHEAVTTIHKNYGLNVAAHLTCVDATREETLEIARAYAEAGVKEIVALRGDPPKGASGFTPHPEGFASSVELVEALAETGDFRLHVGAYPEPHPESPGTSSDVAWLRRKVAAGASSAITQFFFSPDILFPLPRCGCCGRGRCADHTGHHASEQLEGRARLRRPLRRIRACITRCTLLRRGGSGPRGHLRGRAVH